MAFLRIFFTLLMLVSAASAITLAGKSPHCVGNRSTIVHLFEWKWNDIAKECKDFLGPYGFCGVQVSPPNENRIVTGNINRPWYERYQPVSYNLNTRSGTEDEFKAMVKTCNEVGVRIYADAVINHMAKGGFQGQGTGGSSYDSINLQFPAVPYGPNDFNSDNCPTLDKLIHSYNDANEIRNCRLENLLDLKMSTDYVRGKIVEYLDKLTDYGVAGFRIDAAKHMWPADLLLIVRKLKKPSFGDYPFVYQEVIDDPSQPVRQFQYLDSGRVTNFKFGIELARVFRKQNPLKYLQNWGEAWNMPYHYDALNFIDNHDNQRGHGGGGAVLTSRETEAYKLATAFMLAHPYGVDRVMSSYTFTHDWEGPPHNDDMSTKDVRMNGFLCQDGWVCEHRWRQIYNMVAFNNVARMGDGRLTNWQNEGDWRIAFSRGTKAFIAFNLEDSDWDKEFSTNMTPGTYCDIISGNLENGKCTGKTLQVNDGGLARINVCGNCEDSVVAIHDGAKIGQPVLRF